MIRNVLSNLIMSLMTYPLAFLLQRLFTDPIEILYFSSSWNEKEKISEINLNWMKREMQMRMYMCGRSG